MTDDTTAAFGTRLGHIDAKTEADLVYARLREMIIRTELAPGQQVSDTYLSALLDVGRTPLRDAMHRLAHEGLVDIVPRRGTYISQVTLSDLQQIFELRVAMEQVVAEAVVRRVTETDIVVLNRLIAAAEGQPGPSSSVELDEQMHSTLLNIASNRYLTETYHRLADASLRLLYLTRCGMESKNDQVATLTQLRDGLASKDEACVRQVLRAHLRAFRERVGGAIMSDSR